MKRFFTKALFLILFLIPAIGICQISVPKWVDDIGGGGSSSSIPATVRVDKQNNVYVTGIFSGTVDFDPSAGVYNLTSVGGSFDTYVAKYTSAGALIWAVSFGGTGTDQVNGMSLDDNGNPTVIGQYDSSSMDVDPGPGVFNLNNNGDKDGFIVHFDTNGKFIWAKSIGGGGTDYGDKVTADHLGNVIAVLQYESTVNVDGKTFTSSGSFNGLIVKYDINGILQWAINLSDTGDSEGRFVETDSNNNIVVSGAFSNLVNFNPLGAPSTLNGNGNSTFLAKYTPAGNLIWVQQITGNVTSNNSNLCINSKGDIFIDGPFSSTLGFGSTSLNPVGTRDIFVAKYSSGGTLQWTKDIGGSGASLYNYGITASQDDNFYISGFFSGTVDFDPSPTSQAPVSDHGQQDLFLAKYDSDGNYKWAFSAGNSSCSQTLGRSVAIDGNNDVLLAGSFCSTVNFDASKCSTYPLTAQSNIRDSFLAKYVQSTPTAASQITAFSVPQQSSPAVIDQTKLQITVTVPTGTNVSALVPNITTSSGVTLKPASGTAQNFTSPVAYTLSSSCASLNYTVNVAFSSNAKTDTTCSGASHILKGDAENPTPDTYTWQLLQNNVWINAPGNINNADYQTSTLVNNTNANVTFSLRRQITVSGNTMDDSFYDVTVQPIIVISNNLITPPSTTKFCNSGDPAVIIGSTPSGGNGSFSYQWQTSADSLNFTNISGATGKDYDPPTLNATAYFRRVASSGNCTAPVNSDVVGITIEPALSNNTITPPAVVAFCTSGTPSLIVGSTPAGGNGSYNYQWQTSADNSTFADITGAVAKDYIPPLVTTTTYYRRSVTSGACNVPLISNVVTITVTPTPATPVPVNPVINICSGNTASLAVSSPQQGITYNWYDSPSKTNLLFTGATYVTAPLNASAIYYVGATNGSCSSTLASVQVNVNSVPASPTVANSQVPICQGSTATLSISNPQPGITYNWYTTSSGGSAAFTGASFTTPAISSNSAYYAEATNSSGCTSAARTVVNVIANPLPQLTSQGASICPGASANISATGNNANVIVNWYATASDNNKLFSGNNFVTPNLSANTTYYAEGVDNTTSCVSATRNAVQVIILQQLPAPVVTVNTTTSSSITFQWTAVNGATGYQVSIDNGQTFTAPSSGSNGLTHTVSGLQTQQSVTILVQAVGNAPCQLSGSSTAVTALAVNQLGNQVFVANVFTPNGDGRNDIVYVHSPNIKSLKFYIYDQWGELLYTSLNQNDGWDGTYKGKKEPVGVYVYYVEATMIDGQVVNKKGTITLLR